MSEPKPPRRRRPYHPLAESTAPSETTPSLDRASPARRQRAETLVKRHALLNGGAALVPLPMVGALAMLALQIRLIQRLSHIYEVPFSHERGRAALVGLLMGSELQVLLSGAAQFIPGWGYVATAGPQAVLFSSLGYGVGKIFIQHFEAGGTLLDFDPAAMRQHFQQVLRQQQPTEKPR